MIRAPRLDEVRRPHGHRSRARSGTDEAALRRNEDRFRLMVEGSTEVFFYEHGADDRFTYLSPSVRDVTGYDPSELLGQPYQMLLAGGPEDLTVHESTERALRTGRRQGGYRALVRHRDGHTIVLEIVESPLESPDGSRGIHGFARDVSERQAAEEELRRRLDAEKALARVSSLLTSPHRPDLDAALRVMGELLDVSRAYLFQARDDGRTLDNTHEWCAPGVSPQIDTLRGLPADDFPWWMSRLRRGETICIPDVDRMPVDASAEREALEAQNVRSALVVPLQDGTGTLLGFLGFDDTRASRRWQDDDVRLLTLAAQLVSGELQRGRSRDALRHSEEYFRALIEDAPNLIMVLAADGEIRYLSPAHREILGCEPRSLTGTSALDLVHRDDRPRLEATLLDVADGVDETRSVEARVLHTDGTWRVLAGTMKNLLDVPAVEGIVVNGLDVTDRREAERQLHLLSRAVEASPVSIVITETDGTIVYANPRFSEATGYSNEEAVGRNPRILKSGHTDPAVYRDLWETITAGREWRGELENRRKDGSLHEEMVSISPVFGSDRTVTHFIAVKEDVTERRLLQAQFEQAQRMQMVGRLAGGVAHDINNVLTAIGGYTRFVLDSLPADHPQRPDIEEIGRARSRAAGIVGQLLTFGRRDVVEAEVVDVNDVTREIQRMLEHLIGADIRFSVSLASDPATVRADRTQLEQVLVNLAVNARDAMPEGGELGLSVATVRVEGGARSGLTGGLDEGDYVLLTVTDTGTGIPPEAREHLFEPFFTTKAVGKGSGLGLSTVYGIVEAAGGHLGFDTEVGSGTTFRVYLPAVEGRPDEASPREAAPRGGTEGILLVEDDDAVRQVARRILGAAGYDVVEAVHGRDALERLDEHPRPLDLLLTDTVMPELGGHELAGRIRDLDPDIGVVFMSGYTLDDVEPGADAPHGSVFLRKPFGPGELLSAVREVLDART